MRQSLSTHFLSRGQRDAEAPLPAGLSQGHKKVNPREVGVGLWHWPGGHLEPLPGEGWRLSLKVGDDGGP